MTIEDDIARVHQVTEALAGPQTVWMLASAWIDQHRACSGASVYATESAARNTFRDFMFNNFRDAGHTEEDANAEADAALAKLLADGHYDDGDIRYEIHECVVRS